MGTHHKIMQTECFTILLLALLANTFASDDEQASWLAKMFSTGGELKRNGDSADQEFWGVRGKRSEEGVANMIEDSEWKRSLKPNSLFGSISKKMLKPNSLFNTVGKRSLKPNSLFGAFGKKSLKPNSLFTAYGKRTMKPNGLFTMGKRTLKPNGLFSMSKRSIVPLLFIYNEDEDADYDIEEDSDEGSEEEMFQLKRSADPSFWAARGKRDASSSDFIAARGRRSGSEVVSPTDFDFFAARG